MFFSFLVRVPDLQLQRFAHAFEQNGRYPFRKLMN